MLMDGQTGTGRYEQCRVIGMMCDRQAGLFPSSMEDAGSSGLDNRGIVVRFSAGARE